MNTKFFVFLVVCFVFVCAVHSHPTMYKVKENKVFEADLIPVSSTVIPLPVYQVSYGVNVAPSKGDKIKKPEGPISLVTIHSKKKTPQEEKKAFSPSQVKQISKQDFQN